MHNTEMKICTKCKVGMHKTLFHKNKSTKDGLARWCKHCNRTCSNKYRENNNSVIKVLAKKYREENREEVKLTSKKWRNENKEKIKAKNIRYKIEYPEKVKASNKKWSSSNIESRYAQGAERRAIKLRATPTWSKVWLEKIKIKELFIIAKTISMVKGVPHHVDHIVPLKSDIVQGFHCFANLQILTGKENLSKGNRTWPNMPK